MLLLLSAGTAGAVSSTVEACLGCHDLGPDSPPNRLMAGSHGGDAGGTANPAVCVACHGASGDHIANPTGASPEVSFGPRWTASTAAQDGACLACHEQNVAVNWQHSLHMLNNVSCVTCHDIHSEGDSVLFRWQQADICTTCHKAQKLGIHARKDLLELNPACADCHNPHDHESAETAMLDNDSMGCRGCHDLARAGNSSTTSDRAAHYHRAMARPGHTCVDCHRGVAHSDTDSVTAFSPTATTSRTVTLFYPGLVNSEWLLQRHPGSQPLRQGAHCRQCHRGEEAEMGTSLAGAFAPAYRNIEVAFDGDEDSLRMVLEWQGEREESDIALMWGTHDSGGDFNRGGCFAACHSDLPGMPRNRGQQIGKYLAASRVQQPASDGQAIVRNEAELKQMMKEGRFAVLWRIQLNSGEAEAATVLDDVYWRPYPPMRASTSYRDGTWTVKIRRKLRHQPEHLVRFDPEARYTLGIALHGADNPGAAHWVSLPLSFSYRGEDTDFKVD